MKTKWIGKETGKKYSLFGDDAELAGADASAGELKGGVAGGHSAAKDHVDEGSTHAPSAARLRRSMWRGPKEGGFLSWSSRSRVSSTLFKRKPSKKNFLFFF